MQRFFLCFPIFQCNSIKHIKSFQAWLRVSQGLHTREQVIAGTAFGYGMAALWIGLWNHAAGNDNQAFHYALESFYPLSLLYFAIYALKNWRFGDP